MEEVIRTCGGTEYCLTIMGKRDPDNMVIKIAQIKIRYQWEHINLPVTCILMLLGL